MNRVLGTLVIIVGGSIAVAIPGSGLFWLAKAYLILTVCIIGLLFSRIGDFLPLEGDLASGVPILPTVWVVLGSIVHVLGGLDGAEGIGLVTIALPSLSLQLRSLSEIAIVYLVLLALYRLPVQSKVVNRGVSSALLFLILSIAVAWTMKASGNETIYLWTDQVDLGLRYSLVYDLCNSLWLAVLIPMSWCRRHFGEISEFLSEPVERSIIYFPLTLAPVGFGLVYNYTAYGLGVDALPTLFWIKKIGSVLIWTGFYEECVYRFAVVCTVYWVASRIGMSKARAMVLAVFSSVVIFAVVHINLGWESVVFSAVFGIVYGWVFIRTRDLTMCVVGHAITTTLLTRWN